MRTLFEHKYEDLDNNLNEYLFIEVYAFVLDKLREYFTYFKTSKEFVALEDEIAKQERLYEVLVEANLIDQSWRNMKREKEKILYQINPTNKIYKIK